MTLCVCVCARAPACMRTCHNSLNHMTKRVNFSIPKIARNITGEENQCAACFSSSARTPGACGMCTLTASLGPSCLWISGAICRAPSTWEEVTRKLVNLTEVKYTCFPSSLGFKALPRNQIHRNTNPPGAKNPSASSTNTHCQAPQCQLLGRLTNNWQQPRSRVSHMLIVHGTSASKGQHLPGSLAYSLGPCPFLHYITFSTRGHNCCGTTVISSRRQLSAIRRSLFSGSCTLCLQGLACSQGRPLGKKEAWRTD